MVTLKKYYDFLQVWNTNLKKGFVIFFRLRMLTRINFVVILLRLGILIWKDFVVILFRFGILIWKDFFVILLRLRILIWKDFVVILWRFGILIWKDFVVFSIAKTKMILLRIFLWFSAGLENANLKNICKGFLIAEIAAKGYLGACSWFLFFMFFLFCSCLEFRCEFYFCSIAINCFILLWLTIVICRGSGLGGSAAPVTTPAGLGGSLPPSSTPGGE